MSGVLLDDALRRFARFLSASWAPAAAITHNVTKLDGAELLADWAQANWEILVEAPFRERADSGDVYLEPYGEGANCNPGSSRVWMPGALPTHRIVCLSAGATPLLDLLKSEPLDSSRVVVFDHFATASGRGWHHESAPFDCVLGYRDEQEVLIAVNGIRFVAEPCGRSGRKRHE